MDYINSVNVLPSQALSPLDFEHWTCMYAEEREALHEPKIKKKKLFDDQKFKTSTDG